MIRAKRMTGRKCYDHLGGKLGSTLFDFYLLNGWIELEEGKDTVYKVPEKGLHGFEKMGLHLDPDAR